MTGPTGLRAQRITQHRVVCEQVRDAPRALLDALVAGGAAAMRDVPWLRAQYLAVDTAIAAGRRAELAKAYTTAWEMLLMAGFQQGVPRDGLLVAAVPVDSAVLALTLHDLCGWEGWSTSAEGVLVAPWVAVAGTAPWAA